MSSSDAPATMAEWVERIGREADDFQKAWGCSDLDEALSALTDGGE